MRKTRLLAGTILALAATLPAADALAAPNSLRSAPPPPATLRGQPIRDNAQTISPAPAPVAPRVQAEPVQERVQERIQERVQTPPAAAPAEANSGTGIKDAIERLFAASDAQISEKLRDMVGAKHLEKFITRQPERGAAENFYKSRNYAPLWIADGRLTARAKATIARLQQCRRRRARSGRLSGAGIRQRRQRGRPCRSRRQADQFGARLCTPFAGRPHRADSRVRRSRLWRQSHARSRRHSA